MTEKDTLQTDIDRLELELSKTKRKLEKLENANTQYTEQPPVGTVLKFSRTIAGSINKYTFVAFHGLKDSWSVTGRKNALNVIGLTEGGNSWEALTIAIGQEVVQEATVWAIPKSPEYKYSEGRFSGSVYRVRPGDENKRYAAENYNAVTQDWHFIERAFNRIETREIDVNRAVQIAGPKAVAKRDL